MNLWSPITIFGTFSYHKYIIGWLNPNLWFWLKLGETIMSMWVRIFMIELHIIEIIDTLTILEIRK